MLRLERNERSSQRGMSLVETLVAVTIFTVVFLAALGLYQAANRAYMATDAATIQQQNARFAMDRMSETLRDAGANYNTTGKVNVADEQIEGAWESAIFVRGDFDNSRETALENTTFPIVSTGNDEIVGYVLRKPGGDAANTVSITINADLTPATGRNALKSGTTITGEETPTIKVAATNLAGLTAPPYELTRVTFNAAGEAQYQVIAQNIFRLSFRYRDAAGTEAITATTATGSADAQRATRATLRNIGVSIISMTDRPDLGYTDTKGYAKDAFLHDDGGAATAAPLVRAYRKFTLTEDIFGVSLGRKGARHNAVPGVVIDAPPSLTVCTGHHLYYFVDWAPSPTLGIATYALRTTAAAPLFDYTVLVPTTEYRFKQIEPTVQAYTFQVAGAAVNTIGAYSGQVTKTTWHDTTNSIPKVPVNVAASQSGSANAMAVTWDAVTTNTGNITDSTTCTTVGAGAGNSAPTAPWDNEAVDMGSYQVYRGLSPYVVMTGGGFVSPPGLRVDNQTIGDLVNTTPTTNAFTDRTAAPCGQYFYRIKALDTASLVATGDGSLAMAAVAKYIPGPGIKPAKPQAPAPVGPVTIVGTDYVFTLSWPPVVRDSSGANAATAHYQIVREEKVGVGSWGSPTVVNLYEVTTKALTAPITADYRYAVKAVYDCTDVGDADRTNQSDWYELSCSPAAGETIAVTIPANGSAVSRPYETGFAPRLTTVGASWTGASLTITDSGGTAVHSDSITAPPIGNQYNFTFWDASTLPDGAYTLTAIGLAGACKSSPAVSTFVLDSGGTCGLNIVIAAPATAYTGSGANAFTGLNFAIQNTCDLVDITVSGLTFTWSGVALGSRIEKVQYNGVDKTATLSAAAGANGAAIPFTLPALSPTVVIGAGSTSNTFRLIFNDNFTSDGTKDGTPGTFSSILATTTAPAAGTDQIVSGAPVP